MSWVNRMDLYEKHKFSRFPLLAALGRGWCEVVGPEEHGNTGVCVNESGDGAGITLYKPGLGRTLAPSTRETCGTWGLHSLMLTLIWFLFGLWQALVLLWIWRHRTVWVVPESLTKSPFFFIFYFF